MSELQACEGCGKELSVTWTDTHGVGACVHCALPYRIYHYEGEGDERKRVDKPPSCPIYPEWIEVGKRYHAETGGKMFPGEFDMGFFGRAGRDGRTYSGATEDDMRAWSEWLKAHENELPKPRQDAAVESA